MQLKCQVTLVRLKFDDKAVRVTINECQAELLRRNGRFTFHTIKNKNAQVLRDGL